MSERLWRRGAVKVIEISVEKVFNDTDKIIQDTLRNWIWTARVSCAWRGRKFLHTKTYTNVLRFSWRQRKWYVYFYATENHFGYAFCKLLNISPHRSNSHTKEIQSCTTATLQVRILLWYRYQKHLLVEGRVREAISTEVLNI